MKKLWSMILAGAMCLNFLPAAARAEENVELYDLWIGGIQVTSANKDDVLGNHSGISVEYVEEENWDFFDRTYVVTLDTYITAPDTILIETGYEYGEDRVAGIYSGIDLTIRLEGNANYVFAAPDSTEISTGIRARGALTIEGEGSLTVQGGTVKAKESVDDFVMSSGIYASGSVDLYGEVAVTAIGGKTVGNDCCAAYSEGICALENIYVSDTKLKALGGEANGHNSGSAFSIGIDGQNKSGGDYTNFSVGAGQVEAIGGTAKGGENVFSVGIRMIDGGLYLDDARAQVTAKSGKTEWNNSPEASEEELTFRGGIYIFSGDMKIRAGRVDVDCTTGGADSMAEILGVCLLSEWDEDEEYWSGGNLELSESDIDGIIVGDSRVSYPELNIKTPSGGIAIYAEQSFDVAECLEVIEPENGKVVWTNEDEPYEYWDWTVYTMADRPAENVSFDLATVEIKLVVGDDWRYIEIPRGMSLNRAYRKVLSYLGVESFEELLRSQTEKEGYIFEGFYTKNGELFDFHYEISEDMTLTAKWSEQTVVEPSYSSEIHVTEGGTAELSARSAKEGTSIVIRTTPNEGYEVESVFARTRWGEVSVTDNGDGSYCFTQPASAVTVNVTFKKSVEAPVTPDNKDENGGNMGDNADNNGGNNNLPVTPEAPDNKQEWTNPFTDVTEENWYYEAVKFAYVYGLMEGRDEATFDPAGAASREQFVTVLWRLAGSPAVEGTVEFTDVNLEEYYAPAVLWAVENKIVNGYDDGRFGVGDEITREQLAVMLYRYVQSQGGGFTGAWAFRLNFSDIGEISEWAWEAMCWCNMKGIIKGREDGTLDPQGTANRAEMAQILRNHLTLTMN